VSLPRIWPNDLLGTFAPAPRACRHRAVGRRNPHTSCTTRGLGSPTGPSRAERPSLGRRPSFTPYHARRAGNSHPLEPRAGTRAPRFTRPGTPNIGGTRTAPECCRSLALVTRAAPACLSSARPTGASVPGGAAPLASDTATGSLVATPPNAGPACSLPATTSGPPSVRERADVGRWHRPADHAGRSTAAPSRSARNRPISIVCVKQPSEQGLHGRVVDRANRPNLEQGGRCRAHLEPRSRPGEAQASTRDAEPSHRGGISTLA